MSTTMLPINVHRGETSFGYRHFSQYVFVLSVQSPPAACIYCSFTPHAMLFQWKRKGKKNAFSFLSGSEYVRIL